MFLRLGSLKHCPQISINIFCAILQHLISQRVLDALIYCCNGEGMASTRIINFWGFPCAGSNLCK